MFGRSLVVGGVTFDSCVGWHSGKINLSIPAAKVAQVSSLLAAGGVITMAKGNMGNAFKFFMHATETSPSQ